MIDGITERQISALVHIRQGGPATYMDLPYLPFGITDYDGMIQMGLLEFHKSELIVGTNLYTLISANFVVLTEYGRLMVRFLEVPD